MELSVQHATPVRVCVVRVIVLLRVRACTDSCCALAHSAVVVGVVLCTRHPNGVVWGVGQNALCRCVNIVLVCVCLCVCVCVCVRSLCVQERLLSVPTTARVHYVHLVGSKPCKTNRHVFSALRCVCVCVRSACVGVCDRMGNAWVADGVLCARV